MNKNTINAVMERINSGETQFSVGKYFYKNCGNGILRRREQLKKLLAEKRLGAGR